MGLGQIVLLVAGGIYLFKTGKAAQIGGYLNKSSQAFKDGLEGKDEQRPVRDVTPPKKLS